MTMSDGVVLNTVLVLPKDYVPGVSKYPLVVDRSPYGYDNMEWITDIFTPFGYAALGQDVRGTAKSGGKFNLYMSEGDDYRTCGDWVVAQEWSNGQVFTFGASADGIAAIQATRTDPAWLSGLYLAWAPARLMYGVIFPSGAYKQETAEEWLQGISMPDPNVVNVNIETLHQKENNDTYWRSIELGDSNYATVDYPSGHWSGWYDLFLTEHLVAFHGYNQQANPSFLHQATITVDPCGHCQTASVYFTEHITEGRTLLVLAQAFATFGIHPVVRTQIKNVTFYVMSSNDEAGQSAGQFWTTMESFPTPRMASLYLQPDKSLNYLPPAVGTIPSNTSYTYDPANFIPTAGGNNLPPELGGSIPCGPLDQSELDQRSDVLVFETPTLTSNLVLTGPLFATLYVSSSAIDTDFMVKISDSYPTGEVRLLQDSAVRMRWREGGDVPVYMTPGEVYKIEVGLWNTSYIVAPGHKLRVSIMSSNNPRFSVNPNNGILLADPAYPGPNITAVNTLYHSAAYPSHIQLPVIEKVQLPKVNVLHEVRKGYPQLFLDGETDKQAADRLGASLEKMWSRMKDNKRKLAKNMNK